MNNKNSRTKNSIRNVFFALVFQFGTTILQFFTRTALIKTLGIESVSLNGLFTEVIAMLSLAEMGVGSAIVYNLYKPLAVGDHKKVSQLMNLYRTAYHVIALVTFILGCSLIPFIQYLVKEVSYSLPYIRWVYFLFVIQTSSSYLFSYKTSLLNADQKKYIVSIIQLIAKIVNVVIGLTIIFTTRNYICYLVCNIGFTMLTNVATSVYVDKNYTYLDKTEKLPRDETKDVFRNIKYLFIRTISGRITNSTDNILISTMISTLMVGYYSNYVVFFNIVRQLANQFAAGITGSLGNLYSTEDKQHCVKVFDNLSFMFYLLATVGCTCLYVCIDPVIELWLGTQFLLERSIVFVCILNLFIDFAKMPLWQILEVSGLFKEDKNISIIGSIINLIVSIAVGLHCGIVGIFLGTLCTYVIQVALKTRLIYKKGFSYNPKKQYFMWVRNVFITAFLMYAMRCLCEMIVIDNLFVRIIVYGIVSGVGAMLVNIVLFVRTNEFKYMTRFLKTKF